MTDAAPVPRPPGDARAGRLWRGVCGGVALVWAALELWCALALLLSASGSGGHAISLAFLMLAGLLAVAGLLLGWAACRLLHGGDRTGRAVGLTLAWHVAGAALSVVVWCYAAGDYLMPAALVLALAACVPPLALALLWRHGRVGARLGRGQESLDPVPYLLWGSVVTLTLALPGSIILLLATAAVVHALIRFGTPPGEALALLGLCALLLAVHLVLVIAAVAQLRQRALGVTLGLWAGGAAIVCGLALVTFVFVTERVRGSPEVLGVILAGVAVSLAGWLPFVVGLSRGHDLRGPLRGQERPAGREHLEERLARDRVRSASRRLGDQAGRVVGNAVLLVVSLGLLGLLTAVTAGILVEEEAGEVVLALFPAAGLALITAGSVLSWGSTYRGITLLRVGALVGLLGSVVAGQMVPRAAGLLLLSLAFLAVVVLASLPFSRQALAPGYHPHHARGQRMAPCPGHLWLPALTLVASLPGAVVGLGGLFLIAPGVVGSRLEAREALPLGLLLGEGLGYALLVVLASRMLLDGDSCKQPSDARRLLRVCSWQVLLGLLLLGTLAGRVAWGDPPVTAILLVVCFLGPGFLGLGGSLVARRQRRRGAVTTSGDA